MQSQRPLRFRIALGFLEAQGCFGIREDAESTNNLLKSQLWGRRLRTADPSRNDLDLALWAFCQNVKALHANRQRTGLSSRGDPARAG